MPFWANAAIEPKRSFLWQCSFRGAPQFIMKSMTKPSYALSEIPHRYLSYEFYYPGVVTWEPITMVIVDPINPDASATMMKLLTDSGYISPEKVGPDQIPAAPSKAQGVAAVGGNIKIDQLGINAEIVETWTLHNPWIKEVKFGELNMAEDAFIDLELTFRYDWATIKATSPVYSRAQGDPPRIA